YKSTYDSLGNKLTDTDPLTHTTQFVYDDFSRLIQTIQPIPDGSSGDTDSKSIPDDSDWDGHIATATGKTATLTFTNLDEPKHYALIASWRRDTNDSDAYDKDAEFKIWSDSEESPLATFYANLNFAPEGVDGRNLGAYLPADGELNVTITDTDDNGILTL